MSDQLFATLFFWGIWLLVPALVDGITTLVSLAAAVIRRLARPPVALVRHPLVTIIVPVHNSAATLPACIHSLAGQCYPRSAMQVLMIDNGSRDDSHQVFQQAELEVPLAMSWYRVLGTGKSRALNVGIHLARGEYIFNVDSDAVLAPDAVRRVVEAMEAAPDLAAVTGAIQVLPPAASDSLATQILGRCEFFEYLSAFHVGREQQTMFRNIFTLSGAFSVFRRDVLLRTTLYNQETVTEDTDITFQIYDRFRNLRIGCVSAAVAYVHPIESLGRLYAQRVRWQRGQAEVSGRYERLMRRSVWRPVGFAPARTLMVDHTLAFPRLVWTLLLPVLLTFGYPAQLMISALVITYCFYLLLDAGWVAAAWLGVGAETRRRIGRELLLLPLLPLYRALVFWFRLAGFLYAAAEPGAWRVEDPVTQTRAALADLRRRVRGLWA